MILQRAGPKVHLLLRNPIRVKGIQKTDIKMLAEHKLRRSRLKGILLRVSDLRMTNIIRKLKRNPKMVRME